MAVLTAASADVGYSPFRKLYSDRGLYLGYFLLTAMSKMRQNPFIICGSTVRAGNIVVTLFNHKGLNMAVIVVFPCHISSCMALFLRA